MTIGRISRIGAGLFLCALCADAGAAPFRSVYEIQPCFNDAGKPYRVSVDGNAVVVFSENGGNAVRVEMGNYNPTLQSQLTNQMGRPLPPPTRAQIDNSCRKGYLEVGNASIFSALQSTATSNLRGTTVAESWSVKDFGAERYVGFDCERRVMIAGLTASFTLVTNGRSFKITCGRHYDAPE